jgi:hypothetical protein
MGAQQMKKLFVFVLFKAVFDALLFYGVISSFGIFGEKRRFLFILFANR